MSTVARRPERALWPPPRGPRDSATGAWRWSLWARPREAMVSDVEAGAVEAYRRMVRAFAAARDEQRLSMQAVRQRSGVAVDAIYKFEHGKNWPRLTTVARLAESVGLCLAADGRPEVTAQLLEALKRRGVSRRQVALRAGLRPITVQEVFGATRSPRLSTVLAIAQIAEVHVALTPASPQPRAEGSRRHRGGPRTG